MPCKVIEQDGAKMIVCSRERQPKQKCYICGKSADYLCDWVLEYGLENPTCDRPMCNEHRKIMCEGIDYCPEHAELHRQIEGK